MKAFSLGKIQRQVMRQDTVPQFGLRSRDDLMGLGKFLNVGNAGHMSIPE